jgi:hypothetical protein
MTSDLRGLLADTALEGDSIPLSVDDMIRGGRRRRRLIVGSAAATLAVAGIVTVSGVFLQRGGGTSSPSTGQSAASAGVTFQQVSGGVTAIFHDPTASAASLHEAFLQHGLDIVVDVLPVSPSLVGQVMQGVQEPAQGHNGITVVLGEKGCQYYGAVQPCPIGVMVATGYTGTQHIMIGRAAKPGELYAEANDPTAQGEALACTHVLGATIPEAQRMLTGLGLTASWTATGSSARVDPSTLVGRVVGNATPISPGQLLLEAEPAAKFKAYPALSWPCSSARPVVSATEPHVQQP